ncbi:hypothetical protein PLANTIT3_61191 [Plantibacter sp. T3]|nr:hypothetical protein PLANTIT3_61191 [Plantibacter sp. T3]
MRVVESGQDGRATPEVAFGGVRPRSEQHSVARRGGLVGTSSTRGSGVGEHRRVGRPLPALTQAPDETTAGNPGCGGGRVWQCFHSSILRHGAPSDGVGARGCGQGPRGGGLWSRTQHQEPPSPAILGAWLRRTRPRRRRRNQGGSSSSGRCSSSPVATTRRRSG